MYLIRYSEITTKVTRDEGFFFTDTITRKILVEKSKIVYTEEEVMEFNDKLDGNIISVTKI